MAHSIRGADAGVDCPGSFTTETKEELRLGTAPNRAYLVGLALSTSMQNEL